MEWASLLPSRWVAVHDGYRAQIDMDTQRLFFIQIRAEDNPDKHPWICRRRVEGSLELTKALAILAMHTLADLDDDEAWRARLRRSEVPA